MCVMNDTSSVPIGNSNAVELTPIIRLPLRIGPPRLVCSTSDFGGKRFLGYKYSKNRR